MTRSRIPNRRGGRGRKAVRLLVVVGALSGLFAMHGLNDHGASTHKVNTTMDQSTMVVSHAAHAANFALSAANDAVTADVAPGGLPVRAVGSTELMSAPATAPSG